MKLNYEPVAITNLILAVLAVLSIQLTDAQVGYLGQAVAFIVPNVVTFVERRFTRSVASLRDEGVAG